VRILVTGATGFIGLPAVAELRGRGFEVLGVARHPVNAAAGACHAVDLLDEPSVNAFMREVAPSHLLHFAWCTEHGRFWDDPANDEWSLATLRLVEAFRRAGGRRVVLAGSCTQYDWSDAALAPEGVVHERSTRRAPQTPYGRAKESTARELEAYGRQTGLSIATGLVFFPYGPHEKPERLVPSVIRRLLAGEPAETTAGTQVRDFLHVHDCAAAFAALVESDVTGMVNIGSGEGTTVAQVAKTIARILDQEHLLRPGALRMRDDEPARLVADPTRLRDEVGFIPAFDLESGLRDAIDWWRRGAQ
jgi:nucleoside-diphosphate-sugar epimerase